MKPIYAADLAYVHHIAFSGFVRDAAPGLLQILRQNGIHAGPVIDLGCGGGTWARELARHGYEAMGFDVSPTMVALARKTAPQARFRTASLLNINLPRCAAVTALGEVLNYAFARDNARWQLKRFFRRIYQALKPGGVFVFDLAGPERECGRAPRRWHAGPDWAILLEVNRSGEVLSRDFTIFRKLGDVYRHSRERHQLRLYSPSEILTELRNARFTAKRIRSYGKKKFDRGLAGFVARKPGEIRNADKN